MYHAGSGTSGSRHNAFKVKLAARNSVWLIHKNMPRWQVVLNAPLLGAGFLIKWVYFCRKKLGREYLSGLSEGFKGLPRIPGAPAGHTGAYLSIQLQLWKNCFLRAEDALRGKLS